MATPARQRSAAVPLALMFTALVVYASLYPFSGWHWPPGHDLAMLLKLPRSYYQDRFDVVANLVGYMPLGALYYAAVLRSGGHPLKAAALGLFGPAALSYAMEATQNFLPQRVPSVLDFLLNAGGGVLGTVLGGLLQASGQFVRWQALRDRWFTAESSGARALLLLWPLALLFPAPVPLGLGQIAAPLRTGIEAAFDQTPWADAVTDWLAPLGDVQPLSLLGESLAIALGLLAPCLLAYAAMRPGVRRLVLALAFTLLAWVTTTLSTALNFGPAHATAWLTPAALPGLGAGLVAAAAVAWVGRRLVSALGLVVLTALVVLVAQAPSDPYFAESLQAWQQGRFIRFHGLAQWVGWLWPYGAMAWLLWRLGARDRG
jgi:VanZ family protein